MRRATMKSFSAGAAMIAILCVSSIAGAATITQWTMEGLTTPPDLTDSAVGPPVLAATGVGTLNGVHASAVSDWTTPVGNGSAESYSVNTWALGDYFQFSTSSLLFENIMLSVDATSSNTGPRDFKVQYSNDGTTFTDSGLTYSVLANAAPNSWTSGTYLPQHTYTFDLSSIAALDNQAVAAFRLVQDSTVSANGGVVAAGGTSRIDNVTVSGDVIPEPATIALIGLASLGLIAMRRRAVA